MNPLQVKEVPFGKGRKKRPNKEEWKRNKAKNPGGGNITLFTG